MNHYATEGFLSPPPHCKIQHVQYAHTHLSETVRIGTEKPGIDLRQSCAERTLLKEIWHAGKKICVLVGERERHIISAPSLPNALGDAIKCCFTACSAVRLLGFINTSITGLQASD